MSSACLSNHLTFYGKVEELEQHKIDLVYAMNKPVAGPSPVCWSLINIRYSHLEVHLEEKPHTYLF